MKKEDRQQIVISDDKHGLPYSKGLMTSSIMMTGLAPEKAYLVAAEIQEYLREKKISVVTLDLLKTITFERLDAKAGPEYAERYLKWQTLTNLDKPLIILIGGTTGVGKSTVAAEVAHRFGITRISSTDSIREVMRAVFSEELIPALYNSSFNTWQKLKAPVPEDTDPVILGFREQSAAVMVGVKAIIKRAIREQTPMVVEGVHLVPGFMDPSAFKEAFVINVIISVEDEEIHRSHFFMRGLETKGTRPMKRYKANFEHIRKIGSYIEKLAKEHGVPDISSYNLDTTVNLVMEEVMKDVVYKEAAISKSEQESIERGGTWSGKI